MIRDKVKYAEVLFWKKKLMGSLEDEREHRHFKRYLRKFTIEAKALHRQNRIAVDGCGHSGIIGRIRAALGA